MAEEKEMKKEMKDQIKQENKENKPSLWQRMKKPLAAGLLSASLLITPVKKADAYTFDKATNPPSGEWAERIKQKYPEWWEYTMVSFVKLKPENASENASETIQKSIECFRKNVLSKIEIDRKGNKNIIIEDMNIDPDAFYLGTYNFYQAAIDKYELDEVETYLKRVIYLASYNTRDYEIKKKLLILKFRSYYNLVKNRLDIYEYIKRESDYKKAIGFFKEALKEYNEDKNNLKERDRDWIEKEGPINDLKNLFK